MKNLIVFLLVASAIGLFFHDKQQSADLVKAQADNDKLTSQLSDSEAQVNGLKMKVQQLTAELTQVEAAGHLPAAPGAPAPAGLAPATGGQSTWGLKDSGQLDRPAYKSQGQGH